jgi:hypothetical protein
MTEPEGDHDLVLGIIITLVTVIGGFGVLLLRLAFWLLVLALAVGLFALVFG